MTSVYITFTALAQRWEIAVRDVPVISELESVTERLWVGRDATDTVREIVLDAVTWTPEELALVEESFGSPVRAAIEHLLPEDDLDLVVRLSQSTALDLKAQSTVALPGEPGIPVLIDSDPAADGTVYEVPAPFDPALIDSRLTETAELHLRHGELRVVLPRGTGGPDLWVRISAASTGALLHIAPVQSGEQSPAQPAGQIEMTWGLGEDLQQIHLRVTPDPTVPVGDQSQRRMQWAENLLVRAGESSRRSADGRPKRVKVRDRRQAAKEAEKIADILGDESLRTRARAQLSLINRWRIARFGLIAIALVVAGALMSSAFSPADNGAQPADELNGELVDEPNDEPSDEADDEEASDEPGGEVGPVVFSYSDRTTVRALLLGGVPEFRPGDQMSLTATLSTVIWMGFSDPDTSLDDETATRRARSTCLEAQNTSAQGNTYNYPVRNMIVRLSRRDEATGTSTMSVVADVLDLNLRWSSFSSIQETCNAPGFGRDNRFAGEVVVSSFPLNFDVTLPRNLPAGLWDVALLLEDQPIAADGALRLRVRR
jgi:hypothetical protein